MSRERELGMIALYDRSLAAALSAARLSEERLKLIRETLARFADDLEKERRWNRELEAWRGKRDHELRDLRIHLRDRDAHIKNLEAQLTPLLAARQPETEAML